MHRRAAHLVNKLEPLGLVCFRTAAPFFRLPNRETVTIARHHGSYIRPVDGHRVLPRIVRKL